MSFYILLSKLTPDGRRTIKERPQRMIEVAKELEKSGVRVIEQYATLGPYDFVNVVEAPDNETIGKMSVDLCSRGTVEIMTLSAIPIESYISTLRESKTKPGNKKSASKSTRSK